MIRIHAIELLNWDLQPHQQLRLGGGVTLLTGENGSGKTSVLDAIKVALGVTKLDAHRTIDGYLGKQAAPVAMVRLVLDNRPLEGTRRRPLDRLQPSFGDLATLAVAFRSDGEKSWNHDYYVLDGDSVPLSETSPRGRRDSAGPRPLPGVTTYRQHLRAIGVSDQYRKLLELGQGKMASLCALDGDALFDTLFDLIGGRDTLVEWQTRRTELAKKHREIEGVQDDLTHHRQQLSELEARARRHGQWRQLQRDIDASERALPHLQLAAARKQAEAVLAEAQAAAAQRQKFGEQLKALGERIVGLDGMIAASKREQAELQSKIEAERGELTQRRKVHLDAERELAVLDASRKAAEGIEPDDVGRLQTTLEARRVELAAGQQNMSVRAARRDAIDADLARLAQGLLPFPRDVEQFRDALRREGIPHHLLAEVVDVADPAWIPALEGFLGALRLAVVVHDAEGFDRAVDLARRLRYPHGVLAPDVRGRSPDDDDGLLPMLLVKEPRFRPLLARIVRRLVAGNPQRPYQPPRDGDSLAEDGFLLGRLVSRCVAVEQRYLGREALESRKKDLNAERRQLGEVDEQWLRQEVECRKTLGKLDKAISRQHDLQRWLDARDRHADLNAHVAHLAGKIGQLDTSLEALGKESMALQARIASDEQQLQAARKDQQILQGDVDETAKKVSELDLRCQAADVEYGRCLAEPLLPKDAAVEAVLAESRSREVLEARLETKRQACNNFAEADRDPLVPEHFERQKTELGHVEQRLQRLRQDLEETRRAADEAHEQYVTTTRRVFRSYFTQLGLSAEHLGYRIEGRLEQRQDEQFRCDVRIAVEDKAAVHHDSEDLSGGQKAALSMLMAMTAVSLEGEGPGFFLVDEPFAASDVGKINELGRFLQRTGARYLLSMPTSADLQQCQGWLRAVWVCTKTRGGIDAQGRPVLALPIKQMFPVVEEFDG